MLEKFTAALIALLAVIGALGVFCTLFANVLPDGKWKTAFSYAGIRLLKAHAMLKGAMPEEPKTGGSNG